MKFLFFSGPKEMLVLARRKDLRLISLDTPDHTAAVLPVTGVHHATAVDYDPIDQFVYWTDDKASCIQRAKLDGKSQSVVVKTEVIHADGVAVDWVARNLYWSDTGMNRIEVARLNGTSRKILIPEELDEPRAIAVDPEGGLMFWTDWGQNPKIERAALDGSDRLVVVDKNLVWPNGIVIDFELKKIYWGDAQKDVIETSNLDGSYRKIILKDQLPHIFGFSLLGDFLYWTDWQKRSIERAHKITGEMREIVVDQLPDVMGLKAVNVSNKSGWNPCADNNGNCSHLCFNRPKNNYTCGCPIGYELTKDEKNCVIPQAFLLYTQKEDIRRISLQTTHNVPIPVTGIKEANSIDFDSQENRLYWSDISAKSISRAFMNGSQLQSIVEFGLGLPEDMAVDWLARNIYWTDMGNNRIEAARLDGTSRRVLLWNNISEPRSLTLDPTRGFLYWSEWSDDFRISKAYLDGSHPNVLIRNVGRVNGLTIDFEDSRIFWTDINNFRIESSDFDGRNRQVIVSNLPQPYGLTLYEDFVYWADWTTKTIERANKNNGQNRTRIQGQLNYIMDILVFHSSRQAGRSPCAVNNGGCSHLCLGTPSMIPSSSSYLISTAPKREGPPPNPLSSPPSNTEYESIISHSCACPTHHVLQSDRKTCAPPSSFLLYSQKTSVSRYVLKSDECPTLVLPIPSMRNIRVIDFDPMEQQIYWIDGKAKTIRRAHHNGTNVQNVVSKSEEEMHPHDIALDPSTRLLFWSCAFRNIINITRLDRIKDKDRVKIGSIIGAEGLDKPRSLAVHPSLGIIVFVNMVSPPKIEQANLNGRHRKTIVQDGLTSPSSVVIDIIRNNLFWIDQKPWRIETATLKGMDRKVLVETGLQQPQGLAVHGDFLYWIDSELNHVERVHKITGQQRSKMQERLSHLSDLVAVIPHLTSVSYMLNFLTCFLISVIVHCYSYITC